MKIAIVPSWYNSGKAPSRGGFVKDQALALAQAGHEVVVIAFDRDAPGPLLRVRRSNEAGIAHYRIAVPSPWHRLLGFYLPGLLVAALRKILEVVKPDVVHAHAVRPAGVVAHRAARALGLPYCLTEHSGPLRKFWFTLHGWRQISSAYSGAERLFAVSESLRRDMRKHFPRGAEHAEVLYNGIETSRFPLARASEAGSGGALLFVGGLVEEKGLPYLLEAVARLPSNIDWQLSIVGIGPLKDTLCARARALGIDGRLHWLGSVPHGELCDVYARHDLLVVSSLVETFSLVSAEALLCGTPVVATACGGPEEVIGPLGLPLVPPRDPDALARAITNALGARGNFDRAGAAASIEARFSMAELVDRLQGVYAGMVQGAR